MPRKQKPPELKERALVLAAGGNASAAARQTGLEPRLVQRWVQENPAAVAQYAALKRAEVTETVIGELKGAASIIMEGLNDPELDPVKAKALQSRAVALGIMDDHYGGRPAGNGAGGTRFGSVDTFSEAERVTLERIERVTIDRSENAIFSDPSVAPASLDPQG